MVPKIKQIVLAITVTGLLVGISLWLFDRNPAHSTEVPANTLLVDVRTPGEFSAGHAPGALSIPLSELARRVGELGPRDRPIAVYCRTGSRSAYAKRWLDRQGFTNVIDVGTVQNARRLRRTQSAATAPPADSTP